MPRKAKLAGLSLESSEFHVKGHYCLMVALYPNLATLLIEMLIAFMKHSSGVICMCAILISLSVGVYGQPSQ